MVDSFIADAVSFAKDKNVGRLGHQLWPCGSDFQYQNAAHWFHNLDKLIHYVNYNASKGGPVVAFCEFCGSQHMCFVLRVLGPMLGIGAFHLTCCSLRFDAVTLHRQQTRRNAQPECHMGGAHR